MRTINELPCNNIVFFRFFSKTDGKSLREFPIGYSIMFYARIQEAVRETFCVFLYFTNRQEEKGEKNTSS